jgi:hypothetical protein
VGRKAPQTAENPRLQRVIKSFSGKARPYQVVRQVPSDMRCAQGIWLVASRISEKPLNAVDSFSIYCNASTSRRKIAPRQSNSSTIFAVRYERPVLTN